MENFSFDLFDILKVLKQKRKTIIIFTILGLVAAVLFVFIRTKQYTSETKIILKSSMYFDRNQLKDGEDYYGKDVFARENEIDKALTVLGNSDVIGFIAEETNYGKVKNIGDDKVFKAIKNSLKIKRSDNSDIEVKFTDENPELAYKAISAGLYKAEEMYTNYFNDFNKDAVKQINFQIKNNQDSIAKINEKIAQTRKDFQLYNILTPTRGTTIQNQNTTLSESNAAGVEQLKTLVTIKDQLDQELASLESLNNQYNNFLNKEKIHAFYKVGGPYVPTLSSNLPAWIVIGASAVVAFIFGCFWVIIGRAWKKLDD